MNIGFVILGAIAALAGLGILAAALRRDALDPKRTAMLIGGMMATAFGLLLAGFAVGYATSAPLDLDSAEGAR